MAVATAAATVAESSPFVLATGAAGAVAVAGGTFVRGGKHVAPLRSRTDKDGSYFLVTSLNVDS